MKKYVNRLILVCALAMLCCGAQAQVKAFNKYVDNKEVSYIYISQLLHGMMPSEKVKRYAPIDLDALMKKVGGIQIITSLTEAAATALKEDVALVADRADYQSVLQLSQQGRKVNIHFKPSTTQISRDAAILMLTEEEDKTVLITFTGSFTLEEIKFLSDYITFKF